MGKPMAEIWPRRGTIWSSTTAAGTTSTRCLPRAVSFQAAGSPREVAAANQSGHHRCFPIRPMCATSSLGRTALLAAIDNGHLLIDMSTIAPATAVEVDDRAAGAGARALDAPVSGGDKGAIAGTLSIMVGGDAEDFQRAMPLFEAMGKTIVHVGAAAPARSSRPATRSCVAINYAAVERGAGARRQGRRRSRQDRAGPFRRTWRPAG